MPARDGKCGQVTRIGCLMTVLAMPRLPQPLFLPKGNHAEAATVTVNLVSQDVQHLLTKAVHGLTAFEFVPGRRDWATSICL